MNDVAESADRDSEPNARAVVDADSQAANFERNTATNAAGRTPGLDGALRDVAGLSEVMGGCAEVYPMLRAFR